MIRRPLPSTGSLQVGSPASPVLRGAPTPCRPFRLAPVPLAGRYRYALASSLPWDQALRPTGQGFGEPVSPLRCPSRKRQGLPGSSGTPCAHALFSDPGGTSAPGHSSASVLPSALSTASAPTINPLSGLHHTAWTLAVYASPPGLPGQRKTRFRLLAKLCRAGFRLPAGFQYRVSAMITSRPPCRGLSWRTERARVRAWLGDLVDLLVMEHSRGAWCVDVKWLDSIRAGDSARQDRSCAPDQHRGSIPNPAEPGESL